MNSLLEKKLSIGLSLEIRIEEYESLFRKYKGYIDSIYFSPPLGERYHSRKEIARQFQDNEENIHKFYEILKRCKEEGIKLDCVLNRPSMTMEEVISATPYVKELGVSDITCLDRHIDWVSEQFPNARTICSFNSSFSIQDLATISSKFHTIVVGREFLRRPDLMKQIYENGFQIKLLVNNGCSLNCGGCKRSTTEHCLRVFRENINRYGANYIYALQSFYPEELDNLLKNIDFPIESIKISNRTSNYRYLEDCLDSYIQVRETDDYVQKSPYAYRLWARSAGFNPVIKSLDNEEIKQYKKQFQERIKY